MASWQHDYLESLKHREECHKFDYDLIDAYTRLADRTAALEAEKALTVPSLTVNTTNRDTVQASVTGDKSNQMRSDLAEALRSKGQLQSRLKAAEDELNKLRQKTKIDARIVKELSTDRGTLIIKVKDRDQELRAKGKLLEEVHNETLALTLQLNMAEQRSSKLQAENKQLVQRWMARMGQEADDMNNASEFS